MTADALYNIPQNSFNLVKMGFYPVGCTVS